MKHTTCVCVCVYFLDFLFPLFISPNHFLNKALQLEVSEHIFEFNICKPFFNWHSIKVVYFFF